MSGLWILFAASAAVTPAPAAVKPAPAALPVKLQLKNGDVITGQLHSEDQTTIRIQTSYAGVLSIAKDAVLQQAAQTNSTQPSGSAKPATAAVAAAAAAVTAQAKPASAPYASTPEWALSLDLAASSLSGKEHGESFSLSQKGEYSYLAWRFKLDSQFDYETKETARKTHKYLLSPGLDYFYAADLFWRAAVDYQYNYLASDYKNIDISTGPGYSFWRNEQSQFDITVLGGSKQAYFREDELKGVLLFGDSVSFRFGSIEWDLQHRFTSWPLEFYSNGNFTKLLSQPISFIHFDREYKTELGARYLLSEHLRLSWGWQYERTDISLRLTGIPDIPLSNRDLRHKLSIGASF